MKRVLYGLLGIVLLVSIMNSHVFALANTSVQNVSFDANNNQNWMHVDLGYGMVYDGPKKIFGKYGDVEILGIRIVDVNWNGDLKVAWNVQGSNLKNRDKYGKPHLPYRIKGYDSQGFVVEDSIDIINVESLRVSDWGFFAPSTVKLVLEEWN